MSSTSSTEKILLALGVGVVIGAGLGILFAPKKGSDTRNQIGEGFDLCKEKVIDVFDHFKKKACCAAENAVEEVVNKVTDKVVDKPIK